MPDKSELMESLANEFLSWETVTNLSEGQITAPFDSSGWSIKDVVAHLWAWQQRSIARLKAAQLDRKPEFPAWSPEIDPNSEEATDQINAWFYQTYHDLPWSSVHQAWKDGFLQFLELAAAIPKKDFFDTTKYPWLEGYSLSDVLLGSYEHHHEHLEPLVRQLAQG